MPETELRPDNPALGVDAEQTNTIGEGQVLQGVNEIAGGHVLVQLLGARGPRIQGIG
jgi:hypothetical protein